MNKSLSILLIGGGVVVLYVAYTGMLCSAWKGITGGCPCGSDKGASPAPSKKVGAGDVPQPSRQYLRRGSYGVSATGGLRVSDAGQL